MYYNKREGIDHKQVVFARVLPNVTREENYRAQFFLWCYTSPRARRTRWAACNREGQFHCMAIDEEAIRYNLGCSET